MKNWTLEEEIKFENILARENELTKGDDDRDFYISDVVMDGYVANPEATYSTLEKAKIYNIANATTINTIPSAINFVLGFGLTVSVILLADMGIDKIMSWIA